MSAEINSLTVHKMRLGEWAVRQGEHGMWRKLALLAGLMHEWSGEGHGTVEEQERGADVVITALDIAGAAGKPVVYDTIRGRTQPHWAALARVIRTFERTGTVEVEGLVEIISSLKDYHGAMALGATIEERLGLVLWGKPMAREAEMLEQAMALRAA